jgi:hypothetical protein
MIIVLAIALGVIAAGAWLVIVHSAMRIALLAPAGQRMNIVSRLVRRQFAEVARLGGDRTIPHANNFLKAVMALIGVLACAITIGAATFIEAQKSPPDAPAISASP